MTKYIDKLNHHLPRDSEEQYNAVKLKMWCVLREWRQGGDSDVLFNCGTSWFIKRLSCNFILKPSVTVTKKKSLQKAQRYLQTMIKWSRIFGRLDIFTSTFRDSHIFRDANLKVNFGFTITSSFAATALKLVTK